MGPKLRCLGRGGNAAAPEPGEARSAAVDSLAVRTDQLRDLAREAPHLHERLLHPWRRRAALRRLQCGAPPRAVLFLCHGNICRSPFAAAAARRRLPASVAVASAGFVGSDRPSPPEAVAVAAERGIDLVPHRSQLIALEHIRDVDLVFVMDRWQRRRVLSGRPGLRGRVELLGDLDPGAIATRAVLDPVGQAEQAFRACYDRIERCVAAFADLGAARPTEEHGLQADDRVLPADTASAPARHGSPEKKTPAR